MSSKHALKTTPLHSDYVKEVEINIYRDGNNEGIIAALKSLWRDTPVLIFRRQSLTERELVDFSSRFGECEVVSRKDILSPHHPEVIYFSTLRYADGRNVGGFAGGEDAGWHSDQTFRPNPSTGAILYAVEVPQGSGDVYWADEYRAYERLPDDVKALIEGKTGRFRYAKRLGIIQASELKDQAAELAKTPDVFHPVVLKHPVTGRKALYADPTTLVGIEGLSDAENERVLPILFEIGAAPDLVYRHRVMPGDVMMWDNGCVMHRRDAIDITQPRLFKRTTFAVPAAEHCVPH